MAADEDTASQIAAEISAHLRGYDGARDYQRLGRCTVLLKALGTEDPAQAYTGLKDAVDALGDGRDARALSNGMNIKPVVSGRLFERRDRFGEQNGGRSAEAVKQWEAKALQVLATSLAQLTAQAPEVVEITVTAQVHDLLLSRVIIERTYADPFYTTPKAREEILPVNMPRLSCLLYALGPGEEPAVVHLDMRWTGQRPHHYWFYDFPGLIALAHNSYNSTQHIADTDHAPVNPVSRIQLNSPVPGMIYSILWPTSAQMKT